MRLCLAAILAALSFIPVSYADDLEPWQEKSIQNVMQFGKVTKAEWGQSFSFWVFVKRDNTDWSAAGQTFCKSLAGAGKPENELIIVTVWDAIEANRGNLEEYAKIPCY